MKFMKLWKNLEKVYDVVDESKKEKVKPQVSEDISCVDKEITALNDNDDDKEDILVNIYGPNNSNI